MNSSQNEKIKLYVNDQYVADGFKNIESIKNAKLKVTLNNVISLKWLVYGLAFLCPLIFFLTIFLQLDKLIIGVYFNLLILIILLNILFMKYSIWGKVPIKKKKSIPYIDLIIDDKHYHFQNSEFDRGQISSDELVMVFYLYIKWYLVLFELLLFLHLVTVFLALSLNCWFGGVLIILSLILACLMYWFLAEILRAITDLFFIKKAFKL